MQTSILAILALAAILGCAHAQVNFNGACPNVQVQPHFNLKKYLGVWYEHSKYPAFFETGGKCIQGKYTLRDDGNMGVNNSRIIEKTNAGSFSIGYAVPVENAKLKVIFPVSRPTNATSNYWVLSTDYKHYSVVYNCIPAGNGTHNSYAWILLRKRLGTPRYFINKAKHVFVKNGISLNELVVTNQWDC